MDVIFDEYAGQVALIRPHMNWPNSQDPFYLYNPTDAGARRSFYLVSYVPTFRFDGKYLGDPSDFGTYPQWYAFVRSTLDSLIQDPAKFRIHMDQTVQGDSVFVDFSVVPEDGVDADFSVLLAAVEDSANIGYFLFRGVMRDYVPSAYGETHTFVTGDSLTFHWAYQMPPGETDLYSVVMVQKPGNKKIMQAAMQSVPSASTEVAAGDVPARTKLEANVPNPFNPTTTIAFTLDRERSARLAVYDQAGRLVRELLDSPMDGGRHTVVWDGRDGSGRAVGSGVYFYRLEAGPVSDTRKMVLIR